MGDNTRNVAVAQTGNVNQIDPSNPLYIHSSDSPGMSLVNFIFDGRGFQGWRKTILIALSAKNKLGFINGTCKMPNVDAPDYQAWSRCNDMVTSWLLNSLSKDIADNIIYSKAARDLYTDLEQRFGQSNSAKLFHLQKELSDIVQGNTDVAGYFTKIKRLWDELDSLNTDNKCSCNCIYGGKEKLTKSLEDEKLINFLMGLNETYGPARSSILMIKPLPNLNHAYSLLLQEENQRELYINANVSTGTVSFMAGKQAYGTNQVYAENQNHVTNHVYAAQRNKPSSQGVWENKSQKPKQNNLFCTYCKKTNHTSKVKKNQSKARSNSVSIEEIEMMTQDTNMRSNMGNNMNQLTKEQYNQAIQYYRGKKMGEGSTFGIAPEGTGNINAATGITYTLSLTYLASKNSSYWIIDSGASEHMCFNPKAPFMKRPQVFGESRDGLFLLQPNSTTRSFYFKENKHVVVSEATPQGKFEPRAKSCVFLGYSDNKKGYKCLDLETKKIIVSRDVKFEEESFPFATASSNPSTIFPLSHHYRILDDLPTLDSTSC
ncbi:uncharacterized protein LOC132637121 [Lycium barbarum]|uniref:uncharacterized protein LOC132637121 n=1 Tax=Lycium barbarum TaxID=112863 RepID=UPI00293ED933|nr:uncharacterized protein LOC132637121 [Lycium barbarum]